MTHRSRIIFRADGNSRIGLGHITRTLALAHMLRDEYECIFAIQAPDKSLKEQIISTCHGIIVLPVSSSSEERFNHELDAYVSDEEIVVLDGYSFSTDYQKSIKDKGAALVCIDDLHSFTFVADAVINQAGGVQASLYNTAPYTKLYLGPEYALLRPPFLKAAGNRVNLKSNTLQIFLCMGGADPENHTLRIANETQELHKGAILEIVVGSAYKHMASMHDWIDRNQQHQLHQNLGADTMCGLMQKCSVAITSASGVAYEYAAVGGALFIIQTADNQESLYKYLLSSGIAEDYTLLPDKINQANLDSTISALQEKQKQVFDGHSPERFRELFSALSLQTKLKVRRALKDDLMFLFHWANDPVVRSHSFNTAPIPLEIHTNWYNTKLENPDSILYIAEVEQEPVAHIRFEISEQIATISYLIGNKFRGKGLGHTLLLKGVKQLLRERTDVNSIEGLVQKENVASVRAFEKAGFNLALPDPQHPKAYKFALSTR